MDNVLSKVKEIAGFSFEDLTESERETVMRWTRAAGSKEITIDGLREFFVTLRMAVDGELATHNLSKEQDLFLKARLKNLIALEAFLNGPKKINEALDQYLKSIKK